MKEHPDDRPGFWRLSHCARLAGMSPEAFEAAAKAGRIPVAVERVSERLALVRVEQFQNWLRGGAK